MAEFSDDREVYDVFADLAVQAKDKARQCGVDAYMVANAAFGSYYADKQNWAAGTAQPVDFANWFNTLTRGRIRDIYNIQFAAFKESLDERIATEAPAIRLAAVNGDVAAIATAIRSLAPPKPDGFWGNARAMLGTLGSAVVVNVFATVVSIVLLGLFVWWSGIDDQLTEKLRDAVVPPAAAPAPAAVAPRQPPPKQTADTAG